MTRLHMIIDTVMKLSYKMVKGETESGVKWVNK